MGKRIFSAFLVVLLVVCCSVPSFASLATPSDASLEDYLANYEKIPLPADNPGLGVVEEWEGDDGNLVASDSDWDFDSWYDDVQSDLSISDAVIVPFASGEHPLSVIDVTADVRIRDTQAYVKTVYATPESTGGSGLGFNFPALPSNQYYVNLRFTIPKSLLPKPGKYGAQFVFQEGHLGLSDSGTAYTRPMSSSTNITSESNFVKSLFDTSNGVKYTITSNIQIGYDTTHVMFFVDWPYSSVSSFQDCVLPVDCLKFTFKEHEGAPFVSAPDVGSGGSAADYTAQQAGQIAQNTASMSDTLKEIVQTISKQLEALWNQQYNYIHLEDMANADKNADKIVNALGNEISVQIENDDRISEDIMANDDKNTDTIVNGYDDSSLNSSNDQLSSALDQQAAQEEQIMGQISDSLESFEFYNPVTQYLLTFQQFGNFLQDLFTSSGSFKDVINLSFIMGIALLVAGLYRFKGGN